MTMTGLGLRALLASQWAQRGRQDTQDRTTEQKTSTRTRHSLSLSLSPPSPNYATFPSFSTSPILHHPLPPSWRAYWRRCSPPFCQWLGSCCWLLIQGLGGGVVVIILLLVLVVVSFCCAVGSAMIPTCSLSIPPSPPFLLLTQPHYTTHPSLSYNNYYNIYSYIYINTTTYLFIIDGPSAAASASAATTLRLTRDFTIRDIIKAAHRFATHGEYSGYDVKTGVCCVVFTVLWFVCCDHPFALPLH